MAGYTKEFLIDAYLSRFIRGNVGTIDELVELESNADKLYDRVGKTKFREYASLDAEALRKFKSG